MMCQKQICLHTHGLLNNCTGCIINKIDAFEIILEIHIFGKNTKK